MKHNKKKPMDPTRVKRGHVFVAAIRRGGKIMPRESRRNDKQKLNKDLFL